MAGGRRLPNALCAKTRKGAFTHKLEAFIFRIRRQEGPEAAPFWQEFAYRGDGSATVASALDELNSLDSPRDADGRPAAPIAWECGCWQRRCGACAMLVNGLPRLACSVFIGEAAGRRRAIKLEPLSKFPVARDLAVDRSAIFESLKGMGLWLEGDAYQPRWGRGLLYHSARCLLCGCCLEACPNFRLGAAGFAGAAAAVAANLFLEQCDGAENRATMAKRYQSAFYGGCGKSMSCLRICPIGLPIDDLLARSNAIAVWGS